MPKLEREVIQSVKHRLESWQISGVVIWWERLQSIKIQHHGNWIMGCRKGTPDFVAVIRDIHKNLTLVFLECKSDTGQLRLEQKIFKDKYANGKDVMFCVITDPKQIDNIMNNRGIDLLKEITL